VKQAFGIGSTAKKKWDGPGTPDGRGMWGGEKEVHTKTVKQGNKSRTQVKRDKVKSGQKFGSDKVFYYFQLRAS